MKKRIKSPYCTNCGKVLQEQDNYCPYCGQENDNKRQSFGIIMSELVLGFLSVDSRMAHSVPALLFRPGFLTREFMRGRREKYLHPGRMFLTIVVIYFLLASISGQLTSTKDVTTSADTLVENIQLPADTTIVIDDGPFQLTVDNQGNPITFVDSSGKISNDVDLDILNYKEVKTLVKQGTTDTQIILDSLKIPNTFWNRFYYSEIIKFIESDYDEFREFFLSKMPWMALCLMPVFAMFLKLLYIRRDFFYIDHLNFAFHLHSFLFMMGVLHIILHQLTGWDISVFMILASILYILLAFKNFYRQKWFKTLMKIFILLFLDSIASIIILFFSLIIVFVLY